MPDKPSRIREKFDQHTTRRALALVGAQEAEWGDTQVPGLIIRIRKSSATWALRGRLGPKQSVFTIGPVGGTKAISVTDARRWATEAKAMLRNGVDPSAWLQEQATGSPVVRHYDQKKDGWTWAEGKEKFLAHIKKHRSPSTYVGYKNTLTPIKYADDFWGWDEKLLKHFVDDDFKRQQAEIFERSVSLAHLTLRTVKSAFSWLAEQPDSGIKVSPVRDVKPRDAGRLAKANRGAKLGRVLTPDTIGRLCWHLAAYDGPASARLAAGLMLMTGQRIETILRAEKSEFGELLDGGRWDIPASHMKSKREHILPLTPVAWRIYKQASAMSPASSKFLFPQVREWKSGKGRDGHLSYRAVRNAMGTLAKPHDDRRSFAAYCETLLGFSLSDIATILDHAEGRAGNVTAERYALGDRSHFKWKILLSWEEWVLQQVKATRPSWATADLPEFMFPVALSEEQVQAYLLRLVGVTV